MDSFDAVDPETLLSGRLDRLDPDGAAALAEHPLASVDREYPHHVGAVDSPDGPARPSDQHPVFYGCFDWHSAVHSHWTLIRLLRLCEGLPDAAAVRASIEGRLTADNVATEVAYFDEHERFERPYGWGWLLRLAAELHLWDDPQADEWRETLRPLEDRIVDLTERWVRSRDRPDRTGTHGNSAFALSCVLDYARVVGDDDLADATAATARRFYGDDRAAPVAYEPLGWDFVSPSLVEADLLRRVYDEAEYREWLSNFLPDVTTAPHDAILDPVAVDGEDGMSLHLVGLNLSRAWCLAGVAEHVADDLAGTLWESARRHADAGVDRAFTDDYAGAHWLSSFVLYLLSREEGGVAPT
jgi:hypothetical protein